MSLPDRHRDDLPWWSPMSPSGFSWLTCLLQASDSFYPTGSYAHSFGLEGMVIEGVVRDRDTLQRFLHTTVLPALERADLPLVTHAHHALAVAEWPTVAELAVVASAMKTATEARQASEKIGRQRAELLAALHSASVAAEYVSRASTEGWPHSAVISAALESIVFQAPLEAALASYGYSTIASIVAAAMKLLRIGQNAGQSLIAEAMAQLPAIIDRARQIPREEIGWFNPWLDIAAARHETADARMFIS